MEGLGLIGRRVLSLKLMLCAQAYCLEFCASAILVSEKEDEGAGLPAYTTQVLGEGHLQEI